MKGCWIKSHRFASWGFGNQTDYEVPSNLWAGLGVTQIYIGWVKLPPYQWPKVGLGAAHQGNYLPLYEKIVSCREQFKGLFHKSIYLSLHETSLAPGLWFIISVVVLLQCFSIGEVMPGSKPHLALGVWRVSGMFIDVLSRHRAEVCFSF